MFRFPSVICTRCTGFFCLAIIKGPPNDIYCIIEEPYKHYFTEKVSYSRIYRKIYIHTKQGTDYFYGKLSDIEVELENSVIPFIRIHQSYLVNYHHISQYQSSKIIMENGVELTVSAAHRACVKAKIHELLRLD
ncbi:LytTR family transcriptional regulator DNA-binding domain-containing protein [Blautia glucerasea]